MTERIRSIASGLRSSWRAAIAWSTAPFFTRLLPFDSWTILFWRGLFGGGLIAVIMVLLQGRAGLRDLTGMGRSGWLVASCRRWRMMAFIPAAATDQRLQCRDHHRDRTVRRRRARLDMASGSPALADHAGERRGALRRRDHRRQRARRFRHSRDRAGLLHDAGDRRDDGHGAAAQGTRRWWPPPRCRTSWAASSAFPLLTASAAVTGFDLFILAMFGFFQVALGLTLFFLGSRLLPSGQAALISTLETPLMPFWDRWLAYSAEAVDSTRSTRRVRGHGGESRTNRRLSGRTASRCPAGLDLGHVALGHAGLGAPAPSRSCRASARSSRTRSPSWARNSLSSASGS